MAIWAAALPQRMSAKLQSASPSAPRRYMHGAPEIYFHKAIDNSRLVRSVDPVRKREMRVFAATVVVFFLMVLVYLCQHCSSIEYGYKIEDLRLKRDQVAEVNRTLQLEEATLKDPQRISELAKDKLGMALPAVGQVEQMDGTGAHDSGAPVMARATNISVISVPN
jgi:cell division protein FtsL